MEEEMVSLRRLRLIALTLLAAGILAACGGGAPAAESPTTAPEPTAKPTSTPRPTAKPKPTAKPTEEPTEEPTAEPEPTAKPSTSDTGLLAVEVADLKTYTHPNGLFSIDVPENWTLKDNSKDDEAIVLWSEPNQNAFIAIDIFEQPEKQTNDQLATFLKDYLERTFGSQTDFSMDEAKESGPSMLIVWSYTGEATGGVKAKLLGNSFIRQNDNKVSLRTIVVPDEQFDKLEEPLNNILGSYTVDSSVSLGGGGTSGNSTREVAIGDLENYTYDTGVFSIDIPNNWKLKDTSKAGEAILIWTDPTGNALVGVDILKMADEQSQDDLIKLLQTFLKNSFSSNEGFTLEDPIPQDDGSVLIVWSYVDKSQGTDIELTGNSFVEQRGDKVSILTTLVPHEQFDKLLDSMNKIIGSYKIDQTAALP
jgi:hypothetical protein